jgi:lipoprotein-anchoring transpeptidase ErfK/SrfK
MKYPLLGTALCLALAACNSNGTGQSPDRPTASAEADANGADSMASQDGANAPPEDQPRPLMQAQVMLDRAGFSPGVVDGQMNLSTRNAVMGFQQAMNLPQTGDFDDATRRALVGVQKEVPATRLVTIPADFAAGPFAPLPQDPVAKSKLPALGYASLEEKLAERFHTTPEVLRALNAAADPAALASASAEPDPATGQPAVYSAGQTIRVPNVGADFIDPARTENPAWAATLSSLGVGTNATPAARIVVSKGEGTLKAYDGDGKLIGLFTVTTGSEHDPLPLGRWKILAVDRNPRFHYNPKLFWDVSDAKPDAMLPPGPNSPVGVVWIDLSKEHYGIHGTPEPASIGHTESHGCVRLTNWDAARLAGMVSAKTQVDFVA